jgi:hypothetical protein
MPSSWQDRLDSASTGPAVVGIAQDFAAQFSDEEIAQLPIACRPWKFLDATEITAYSFAVVRCNRQGDAKTAARIHKLATFSASASIRIWQLTGHTRAGKTRLHG